MEKNNPQPNNSVFLRLPDLTLDRIRLINLGRGEEEIEKARKFALLLSGFDKYPIEAWNGDKLIKRYWKGREMDEKEVVEWGRKNA